MATFVLNDYSNTPLDFLIEWADRQQKLASAPKSVDEIMFDLDRIAKEAALIGSDGFLWDTDQNAAGNLAGYGGLGGQWLGSVGGFLGAGLLGLPSGPGAVATGIAGGAAGGAVGGMAGRGLGYGVGSAIDWAMGNKPGAQQKGLTGTVFNPGSMAMDAGFGALAPLGGSVIRGAAPAALKTFGRLGTRAGLKDFGKGVLRGSWNLAKHPLTVAGTAVGGGLSMANGGIYDKGSSQPGTTPQGDPFANTKGYTQVVGTGKGGFGNVKPMAASAYQ